MHIGVANHCIFGLQMVLQIITTEIFLIYLLFKISIFHSAAVAEGTGVGEGGQSFSPPEQEEPLHAPRPSPCTHFLLHPCTQHVVNN
jgi:hypothetical protein